MMMLTQCRRSLTTISPSPAIGCRFYNQGRRERRDTTGNMTDSNSHSNSSSSDDTDYNDPLKLQYSLSGSSTLITEQDEANVRRLVPLSSSSPNSPTTVATRSTTAAVSVSLSTQQHSGRGQLIGGGKVTTTLQEDKYEDEDDDEDTARTNSNTNGSTTFHT